MSILVLPSDYYLTVGSDNIVKLFHFENRENPLVLVEIKGETIADVCWVPLNPNFILIAAAEGNLYLYDLADTIEKPYEIVPVQKNPLDTIQSVSISAAQNRIVVLSRMGNLWQFELSSAIFDDRFVLDKIYTG